MHPNFTTMKNPYLLPNKFRLIGYLLLIPGLVAGIFFFYLDYSPSWLDFRVFTFYNDQFFGPKAMFSLIEDNIGNEVAAVLFLLGAVMVAFSADKMEDEFTLRLRFEALVWATYVNYAILLLAVLFIHGMAFIHVFVVNLFVVLILFYLRYRYLTWKSTKTADNEE